jgi:hypothetical protein
MRCLQATQKKYHAHLLMYVAVVTTIELIVTLTQGKFV